MNISFISLTESHFPLLLRWLEMPHVKAWWDQDIKYDEKLVKEKFNKHIHGVPISNVENDLIYAYVIQVDNVLIGYIQAYNAFHFAKDYHLDQALIPARTAGLDMLIGELDFLGQGLGAQILEAFCRDILSPHFTCCLVDPDSSNYRGLRTFEKAGFDRVIDFVLSDPIAGIDKHYSVLMKRLESQTNAKDTLPNHGLTAATIKKSETITLDHVPQYIQQLEYSLLEHSVRQAPEQWGKLIADDFIEFGSSGNIYNKEMLFKMLPAEDSRKFNVFNFDVKILSMDVALVTYGTIENNVTTLRSSLWQAQNGDWRMVFHQGTRVQTTKEDNAR